MVAWPANHQRQLNSQWRPDRVVDAAVSWADYMDAMQTVDRACVFGIRFKDGQMAASAEGAGVQWQGDVNAETATFVRAHPAKLVGFMSVHSEEGDVVAEIEPCVTDLGLKGVKLGPNSPDTRLARSLHALQFDPEPSPNGR